MDEIFPGHWCFRVPIVLVVSMCSVGHGSVLPRRIPDENRRHGIRDGDRNRRRVHADYYPLGFLFLS
jgi:hypothetical protein